METLDRLGRTLPRLVDLVTSLERRGIRFESITEAISTESPGGTLIFHMMAALAQFERSLISARSNSTNAALPDVPWSEKIGSHPAFFSAESWRSKNRSSVDTRAYPIFIASPVASPREWKIVA
ncbi:hypothetical protein WT98_30785 [Burkholderia territorii]|nr:hypothetical protein WT98_30785 [Burkholderia territorii]